MGPSSRNDGESSGRSKGNVLVKTFFCGRGRKGNESKNVRLFVWLKR